MKFYKYCGAGNDFVLLDNRDGALSNYARLAKTLCDRHFGIGADGLMVLEPPTQGADIKMCFYNSDGTAAEMCGNGARCICRHCHDFGISGTMQHIETPAGLVVGERISEREYRIALNKVSVFERLEHCDYLELGEPGIPHAVAICDLSENRAKLSDFARSLRHSFPRGANVNLCAVTGENTVRLMTYERGVEDFTLACGTGTGATVYALTKAGLVTGKHTTVHVDGGTLYVDVRGEAIYLTGPADRIFIGEIE